MVDIGFDASVCHVEKLLGQRLEPALQILHATLADVAISEEAKD
jgi:hypothetical protein